MYYTIIECIMNEKFTIVPMRNFFVFIYPGKSLMFNAPLRPRYIICFDALMPIQPHDYNTVHEVRYENY